MLYLHAILLIIAITLPIRKCDGSSLFRRPASYRTHNISISVSNKRRAKNVAFMVNVVPRGGSNDIDYFDSDDVEEYIDNSEYDDTDTTVESSDEELDPILELGLEPSQFSFLSNIHIMHYAHVLLKVTKRACIAGVRAVMMNNHISGDIQEEDSRPVVNTILGRGAYVIGQMYHAALTPPDKDCNDDDLDIVEEDEGIMHKRHRKRRKQQHKDDDQQPHRHRRRRKKKQMYTSSPTAIPSCGGIEEDEGPSHDAAILQLAKQYNINFLSNQLSKRYSSILLSSQITLNEALQKANADARFLICYISKGGPSNTNNALIMPHLLSSEVVKMVNRKPLGKKQTGDTASYYIWITNDVKDVDVAMKRLKVKPPTSRNNSSSKKKSKKSSTAAPILTIVYPSTAIDPSSGGNKLTVSPKILTQHHCHPPPSTSTTLISWMNTIRKRHLREYNKLQFDRKEFQLLKERTEGYAESQQLDQEREEKDKLEKQKKKEEEEKEKARIQRIVNRRKELLENLVEEPDMGEDGVITIALRFTDGIKRDMTTCKRRFDASTTTTNDVFNWIDAVHEMERETVELSTMNGAKKFIYDEDSGEEQTLEDVGLGKMTALRVSEIVKVEDDAEEDETGEEEEESGEEDESEEYDDEESEYDSDEE